VRELYGYDNGLFFVQDEASQICVEALDAREGDTLLDICACPGSKSFGSAIKMNNKGRILSFDLHENKLSLIRSGALRLGIDIIETRAADGRIEIPELIGCADRVLCDVPCSGFGVISKKPELRYKDPKESERLPEIQRAILNNACKYVKRGGVLVYSTCTLLPEENELAIKDFLSHHPEFELVPFIVGKIEATDGYITLYPHIHKTDGFFISKLIRK
jgi:16S rRNA (cytosine967-C5)-methyltransferase